MLRPPAPLPRPALPSSGRRQAPPARRRARGFTLTELMVAVTGGLVITVAVFAVARDTTRFYQREGNVGDATSAAILGFQRLQADIARAGYLSTPNVQKDPRICASRTAPGQYPAGLKDLAAMRIEAAPTGQTLPTSLTANTALRAMAITLAGSYAADDAFPIWGAHQEAAGTQVVTLQTRIGPLSRNGYLTATGQDADELGERRRAILESIFRPGRYLRVVDRAGKHFYGVIAGATADVDGTPRIALASAPALEIRTATGGTTGCGLEGTDLGSASVVSVVRYELQDASVADDPSELGPFEAQRANLVRRETTLATAAPELVAEYAVDLRFAITVVTAPAGSENIADGQLTVLEASTGTFADYVGVPSTGKSPERIRAVRASLSVRSRIPDREGDVSNVTGGLYRVPVAAVDGRTRWARVRTLRADIALRNTEGILW